MVTVMRPMLKAEPLTAQQGGLGTTYRSLIVYFVMIITRTEPQPI